MRTKRTSILLFLSIITMLALAVLPPVVKADEYYYTWDSATHGTNIYAPLGHIGSEADAYADATGLTKVFAYGGFGVFGYAEAWAELYITLSGNGKYVKPIITYEVKGVQFDGGIAKITLTCIDRSTGETIGSWSKNLPPDAWDPVTETLEGNFFEAKSGREYLYWVKVYAMAPITVNANIKVDYRGTDAVPKYVKVNYLCIHDTCTLSICVSSGGTTSPAPGTYYYSYGSSLTVTATAYSGYYLSYWLLDGSTYYQNPITVTMNSDHTLIAYFGGGSGGGGGGCPILFVWNGTDYFEEGLLDIHNPEGIDVVYQHTLVSTPQRVQGAYLFRLVEHPQTHSYIDQVKLYAILKDKTLIEVPLIWAWHSEDGNVLPQLLYSDEWKTDTLGADHNNGITQSIELKFAALPPNVKAIGFIFQIEGNNQDLKE